ncbi:hypothetical protein OIDMADRAFT_49373 [Oidiodendron maius Zn]|uniref:Mid2 domain-containing protein n=1 Tax=Oidiodendron maius (strain Zn) TaxID=913774 RepID=A0A0C3DUT3_OIDMZ|nr:hypothetical protein OIDMADRAFT_49373 [Oidiodendron maius Zn]
MIPVETFDQMYLVVKIQSQVLVVDKAGVGPHVHSPRFQKANRPLVCTNTSLCIAGPTVVLNPGDPEQFEGSCTDKTWNSPDCPSFCRSGGLSNNAANGVLNCTGGDYCCTGSGSDCCSTGNGTFFLGAFANVTTIGGSIGPGFFTTTSSSTIPTTLPASTTSAGPSTTTSASSTTTTTTTATTTPSSHSSGLSPGASAGIGIGVAAVVIACAVGGYFFYRHMSKNRSAPAQFQTFPQAEYYKPPGDMGSPMYPEPPIEMGTNREMPEMGADQHRMELPAWR